MTYDVVHSCDMSDIHPCNTLTGGSGVHLTMSATEVKTFSHFLQTILSVSLSSTGTMANRVFEVTGMHTVSDDGKRACNTCTFFVPHAVKTWPAEVYNVGG